MNVTHLIASVWEANPFWKELEVVDAVKELADDAFSREEIMVALAGLREAYC